MKFSINQGQVYDNNIPDIEIEIIADVLPFNIINDILKFLKELNETEMYKIKFKQISLENLIINDKITNKLNIKINIPRNIIDKLDKLMNFLYKRIMHGNMIEETYNDIFHF